MINDINVMPVESYDFEEKEYFPAFALTIQTDERLLEVVIDKYSTDYELREVFQNMAKGLLDG